MYTDSLHIRIEDPGKIEGNTVFDYLDVFGTDTTKIQELKNHYQRGGLGDVTVKNYLFEVLNEVLIPIRQRRKEFESNKDEVMKIILQGTAKAREVTEKTLDEVKEVMYLQYK